MQEQAKCLMPMYDYQLSFGKDMIYALLYAVHMTILKDCPKCIILGVSCYCFI